MVKNALKFTIKGSIRIIVAYDTANEILEVHIVDTGKGIKEEDFSKLFTLFGTLQRTASLNNEGIGLGLLICKNLVEQNGGKINVHSLGANKGSTFSFSMKMTVARNIKR